METVQHQSTRNGVAASAAIVSVINLLRDAGIALRRDTDEAQRFIDQAAALLRETSLAAGGDGAAAASARCRLAPWQLARVIAYIDANLAERISLEDLAAQTRLSTSYFSRAFRSTVGVPPHAYLIRRRIARAQDMIRQTGKGLSEIALDCGLADQAHMTRHFRRVVGISPGAWRRMTDEGPQPAAA